MVFEISIFICIFILSLLANLTIAAVLLKYPEMRTVNNCFLLNLTAADLAFVAGIPALLYVRIEADWKLGDIICKLLPYSQVSRLVSLFLFIKKIKINVKYFKYKIIVISMSKDYNIKFRIILRQKFYNFK